MSPCLSHLHHRCRVSFTLLHNLPSVPVSYPAAAPSLTSASDSRGCHPASGCKHWFLSAMCEAGNLYQTSHLNCSTLTLQQMLFFPSFKSISTHITTRICLLLLLFFTLTPSSHHSPITIILTTNLLEERRQTLPRVLRVSVNL